MKKPYSKLVPNQVNPFQEVSRRTGNGSFRGRRSERAPPTDRRAERGKKRGCGSGGGPRQSGSGSGREGEPERSQKVAGWRRWNAERGTDVRYGRMRLKRWRECAFLILAWLPRLGLLCWVNRRLTEYHKNASESTERTFWRPRGGLSARHSSKTD